MFEIKSSLVAALLLLSLSLAIAGVTGNDKKGWESVFKTLMKSGDPSKGRTVSPDFVSQELEKWRLLEASQKGKLLSVGSASIMDRISDLNELKSGCDNDQLKKRFDLEVIYNANYVNLHPYIKFINSMLFNSCYQDYKYRLMLAYNANLDKIKFLAWYDATEDKIEEARFEMAAFRSNNVGQRSLSLINIDRELDNIAAKLALYLKHFYHQIESKYFESPKEHSDKIKFEVEGILETVCQRISQLDLNVASGQEPGTSQQQIPTFTMRHGSIDARYHLLMRRVSKSIDGEDKEAFAQIGLHKYQWICHRHHWRQLVEDVQSYFRHVLDERDSEDRITPLETNISQQDLISTRQILFAQNDYLQLRMGNQYDLLDRLYIGSRDGFLAEVPDNLARLIELRQISPDECLMFNSQLDERLDLESIYDHSYVVLHPYIASLNRLQFDLCNQRLRQLVSNAIPRDAVQLGKLERLRSLIDIVSHERVYPNAFAKAVADFLFLSSPSKIPKKLLASKMQELLEETCRGVTQSMSLMSLLERHDALVKFRLLGPMNDATKRALSYGRICKYYEQHKLELAPQIFDPSGWFQTAPERHPNHLSVQSLMSCLKPQAME